MFDENDPVTDGQIAFAVYKDTVECGSWIMGKPSPRWLAHKYLPRWNALDEDQQRGWEAVADTMKMAT